MANQESLATDRHHNDQLNANSPPSTIDVVVLLSDTMAATANLLHVMPDQADMDDDTYELALKILLDDARQMVSQPNAKGKQREDAISDQDFAFNIYAQEIETATARIKDHRVSQGLHNALSTDLEIVARYDHENQMAQYDREYALALHQGREPPPPPRPQPVHHQTTGIANRVPARDAEIKQDQKRPLKRERRSPSPCGSLHGDNNNDEGDLFFGGKRLKTGESSYWAASRQVLPKQQPVVQKRPCTSCTDPIPETRLVRAPCSHEYCHDCLRTLVRKGMLDESLFPPQCCRQAIPADKLAEFLDHSLMTRYHEKEIELSTVNRIYCHKPDCAAFILPALVENDEALCVACGTTTCIHCKRAMHSGDCPLDNELQRVLQVAQQEGWRRCQRCNAMVELNQGCFHMT